MLLKLTRENKLSPNYEPKPYTVTRKDGNAVVFQDTNGNNKLCNIAHMKKFVNPETVDKGEIDPQPHLAEQPVQPGQDPPNPSPSQPAADTREAPSSPSCFAPAWMQDVCA